MSIGLVWGSDKPDPELTTEVARNIGTTILLPDVSLEYYILYMEISPKLLTPFPLYKRLCTVDVIKSNFSFFPTMFSNVVCCGSPFQLENGV